MKTNEQEMYSRLWELSNLPEMDPMLVACSQLVVVMTNLALEKKDFSWKTCDAMLKEIRNRGT